VGALQAVCIHKIALLASLPAYADGETAEYALELSATAEGRLALVQPRDRVVAGQACTDLVRSEDSSRSANTSNPQEGDKETAKCSVIQKIRDGRQAGVALAAPSLLTLNEFTTNHGLVVSTRLSLRAGRPGLCVSRSHPPLLSPPCAFTSLVASSALDSLPFRALPTDLASLASFLDNKQDISVNTFLNPQAVQGGQLGSANEPSSPELTSDSASPASSDGTNSTAANNSNSATTSAAPPLTASRGRASSPMRVPAGTTAPGPAAHDKRKNGASSAGAVKDRKGANQAQGHHSHPTGEDGEFARSAFPFRVARSLGGGTD